MTQPYNTGQVTQPYNTGQVTQAWDLAKGRYNEKKVT